jgi:hypothetical protein
MKDLDIAIVLLGRQQDRLSRQIKALFAEDFDYPTLKRWRDGWATELPFLQHHPDLLPAVDRLLEEMAECSGHKFTLDTKGPIRAYSTAQRRSCLIPVSTTRRRNFAQDQPRRLTQTAVDRRPLRFSRA